MVKTYPHNGLFVFVCEALSLEGPSLITRQGQCENSELLTNMEGFRNSVKHLAHQIDLLEKRQAKVRHPFTNGFSIISI